MEHSVQSFESDVSVCSSYIDIDLKLNLRERHSAGDRKSAHNYCGYSAMTRFDTNKK